MRVKTTTVQKRAIVVMLLGTILIIMQAFRLPPKGLSFYAGILIGIWIVGVGYKLWKSEVS